MSELRMGTAEAKFAEIIWEKKKLSDKEADEIKKIIDSMRGENPNA